MRVETTKFCWHWRYSYRGMDIFVEIDKESVDMDRASAVATWAIHDAIEQIDRTRNE